MRDDRGDAETVVGVVADEIQAEIVCGLLREAGIACGHRATPEIDSALHGLSSDGPREILAHEADAEAARAIVEAAAGG